MPENVDQPVLSRPMQFALFFTGLIWLIAARTAAERSALGLTVKIQFAALQPLLTELFFLFLVLTGFATLQWIATRQGGVRQSCALPKRPTARQEWLTGAALGWGLLLACVLPMMLAGDLHPQLWLALRSWGLAVLSLAAVALGSLAVEAAFRGYLFRHLIASIGPVGATILLSFIYAVLANLRPNATLLSVVITFLAGILYSLAYLRTHAIWLAWGLHFAWGASMGILFGLPVRGAADYASLVQTTTTGADWFTGGGFGPDGAILTAFVLLGGMAVLYRVTRNYAWDYTHPVIVPGGYAVTVQPPAAHTAMEQAATPAPAPLVQIAMATPEGASTLPEVKAHLRELGEARD